MLVSEILKLQQEIGKEINSPKEIEAIIEAIEIEQQFSAFQNRAGKTERAQHAKEHGLVRAKFNVPEDLSKDLQIGIFKAGSSYDGFIRFSNGNAKVTPDPYPSLQGMAIKLLNTGKDNLIEGRHEQDFLLVSYPFFIVKNMVELGEAMMAQAAGTDSAMTYFKNHPEVYQRVQEQKGYWKNPLHIQFFSVTPYQFGERKVKYSVIPTKSPNRGSYTKGDIPADAPPNHMQLHMEEELNHRAVSFDFMVQFYKNDTETPIDDATVVWKTEFVKVATIDIPQQYFTAPGQLEKGQEMSFNPWYSLPVHKPLGSLNDGRKFIYQNLYKFRIDRDVIAPNSPKQHPMNLILKIKETPVTIKSADGKIAVQTKNIKENYMALRAALTAGGTGLSSVKTIHFARNLFFDPVYKTNEDGIQEIDYFKTVTLITSYDEGFADYIIDFAEVIYERFNFLLSFVQGTESIQDENGHVKVQKNTKRFVAFIDKHNRHPVAFYCAYPDQSVVQILQNQDSRSTKLTGIGKCPFS